MHRLVDPTLCADAKALLSSFGAEFRRTGKVAVIGRNLVCFGPEEAIRETRFILAEICGPPSPSLLCRTAAVRVSPELWLKLSQEWEGIRSVTSRYLGDDEVRHLLDDVRQDRESEILCVSSISSMSDHAVLLRDVLELTAPGSYTQRIDGERSAWLPELGESRDVGVISEISASLQADRQRVDLRLRPEHVEFTGWRPIGPTMGLPQYRKSAIEGQVSMDRGEYILLGGAGGGGRESPFVIWLFGIDKHRPWPTIRLVPRKPEGK